VVMKVDPATCLRGRRTHALRALRSCDRSPGGWRPTASVARTVRPSRNRAENPWRVSWL